jgi:hypothetical protein
MAAKRMTQLLPSPTRRFAELLAATLVGAYLLACFVPPHHLESLADLADELISEN